MEVDFNKGDGLVPVIIQDNETNKVLMLGYMNEEALTKTKEENKVTFFSRSKNRLWTKGEESGNFLIVEEILVDCDNDTILIKALPKGPTCHTGDDTCFKEVNDNSDAFLTYLEGVIKDRKENGPGESYTNSLFQKGMNKVAQKVGEEAVELVIEAMMENNEADFRNEAADLIFHYLVLLRARGVDLSEITAVLKERHK
ncbi:MAG: bifunctional phosphoribosyl-AMP cyclohydrolase/phosphoribosyl-ATP diphosphatase HisIE [Flavobacteriales bacterium]|nr:bifunctional phosphoribosyl-AMP cyclohydrolase/phosphoribosyl-ATP diphosphatase HisIE [Flavobacteriales bacterium]